MRLHGPWATVKIRASQVSVNEDLTILSEKFKLLKILHFTVQERFSKSWTLEFAHDTRATTGKAGRRRGTKSALTVEQCSKANFSRDALMRNY